MVLEHFHPEINSISTPLLSTLSSLTRLEHLTICADHVFNSDGLEKFWFFSFIPPVTDLIKTAPILKHLKIAFNFWLNASAHISETLEHFCPSLVHLLTECRATSITLCVSANCHLDRSFEATFLEMARSALTGCAEVNQLVEQDVLVIRFSTI